MFSTCCTWGHGLWPQTLYANVAVPPVPVRFLTKGHLPRISHQPRLSANGMHDNEMKPVTVHRPPDIYLTAEENPAKPQLGSCATIHRLKCGPWPANVGGMVAQHVR